MQNPNDGEFSHSHFKQNRPDLLPYIKRKANSKGAIGNNENKAIHKPAFLAGGAGEAKKPRKQKVSKTATQQSSSSTQQLQTNYSDNEDEEHDGEEGQLEHYSHMMPQQQQQQPMYGAGIFDNHILANSGSTAANNPYITTGTANSYFNGMHNNSNMNSDLLRYDSLPLQPLDNIPSSDLLRYDSLDLFQAPSANLLRLDSVSFIHNVFV